MIRLLRFLLYGDTHIHTYQEYKIYELIGDKTHKIRGIIHIRECTVCGKLKKFKISEK